MVEDLSLSDLGQYYGTQGYTNLMGLRVTDGVVYVMENGYSWVVTDAAVILRMKPRVRSQEFVHVKFRVQKKAGGNEAITYYEDGDGTLLYRQKYKWTNAVAEFDMYYSDGVLMLVGEY